MIIVLWIFVMGPWLPRWKDVHHEEGGGAQSRFNVIYDAINAYNNTHVRYKVQMEWRLVDWKGNGNYWWKGLIPQNLITHIC